MDLSRCLPSSTHQPTITNHRPPFTTVMPKRRNPKDGGGSFGKHSKPSIAAARALRGAGKGVIAGYRRCRAACAQVTAPSAAAGAQHTYFARDGWKRVTGGGNSVPTASGVVIQATEGDGGVGCGGGHSGPFALPDLFGGASRLDLEAAAAASAAVAQTAAPWSTLITPQEQRLWPLLPTQLPDRSDRWLSP